MKKILLLSITLLLNQFLNAQGVFMVCNPSGTSCTPYHSFDDAVTNAVNDDYVYMPGGTYNISAHITKKLHLIGAGFNMDSSAVTEPTLLMGHIQVANGGEGSSFEGFYLSGNFTMPTANDTIRNCTLQKVCINGQYSGNFINCNAYQCVFQNVVVSAVGNTSIVCGNFNNCIFSHYIESWYNSTVQNCLFIGNSQASFHTCSALIVKNSTIVGGLFGSYSYWYVNSNVVAYNNLIINDWGPYNGVVTHANNIVTTPCTDHFDVCPSGLYLITNNYKLKSTSSAKNAGTDGTDIGIYGGNMPWTDGSVPGNPHIYFKNIAPSTNSNNNLPVNIKVRTGN